MHTYISYDIDNFNFNIQVEYGTVVLLYGALYSNSQNVVRSFLPVPHYRYCVIYFHTLMLYTYCTTVEL